MDGIFEADLLKRLQNSRDLQAHKDAILLLMGLVKALVEKVAVLEATLQQAGSVPDIFCENGKRRDIMDSISVPVVSKPRRGRPRKEKNEQV